MAKKTLQERFIAALMARGEHEIKRTNRYVVFSRLHGGFYYIGKGGSLRLGNTIATSVPASKKLKDCYLGYGEIVS